MKILHTSDWHIGKKLVKKARLEEQKQALWEICNICDREQVDLVLVAGDIFDTFIPSADAEEVFFEFINKLATPSRAVVFISGNHDDWQRLSAPCVLASKYNAYIFGGENTPRIGGVEVKSVRAGKNFIEIAKGDECVYVGALPYPSELRLGEKKSDLPYGEKIKEWISECFENNVNNHPQILISHLFMLGGQKSESERDIELGGARIVENSVIPSDILYTALGHLHKRQVISKEKNVIYSGSLLCYSFDEIGHEKSVTLFEICDNKVQNLQIIPLNCGKRLVKIVADNVEKAKELLEMYSDCHVFLTLKLNGVLSESESRELFGNYPQLVDYKLEILSDYNAVLGEERKRLNSKQLFEEYYKEKNNGEQPPEEIMKIYLEAISEEE